MANVIVCGSLLAATILITSCTGSDTSVTSSPAPSSSTATSPSASASQSASPTPTSFTSATYGYTVSLSPGWTGIQAQKAWNGKSTLSSDAAEVDQFPGTYNTSSWALARQSKQSLAAYTAGMIAANAREHGDTCPAKPETKDRISIGGDPGILLAYNCGILINLAVVMHHGVAYQFGFRDPNVKAATDPADQATFMAILGSVQFPD
jgi:hypothetical protein